MKSARNQLILLGFISQAFSWDDYLLPLLSALLWFLCLKLPRKPVHLGQFVEFGLILVGIFAGRYLALTSGKNIGAFVFGYGLTLVQAARLMRPLNHREKIFSIFVACFQIGVACTIVLDYRFALIFLAALILIPRALSELETESYAAPDPFPETQQAHEPQPIPRTSFAASFGLRSYTAIILVAALFYVSFPRGAGMQLPAPRFGNQFEPSMLDSVLDPTRGGRANDNRVILQVEGERLGYLRCFALVDFDGEKWSGETWDQLWPLPTKPLGDVQKYEHRRVRAKSASFLGKTLPTDGIVVAADGKFFRSPSRVQHGIVKAPVMWNTANNFYEYWTIPQLSAENLNGRQIKRLTKIPEQSERLTKWLNDFLEGTPEPLEQARRLEDFFHRNFAYELGAPKLSRVNTADDFIFNQKRGHCERFAAHFALLLRMQGIPSRVVIGYLPNARHWFTKRYNIRFRDAHAWTEAWFKGIGWVQFDATPAATMDRSGNRVREFMDALDFLWYSNVVAFDAPAQSRLLNGVLHFFQEITSWLNNNKLLFIIPLGLLGLFLGRKFLSVLVIRFRFKGKRRQDAAFAEHCYGQMLRALARKGFHREQQQTPLEFLARMEKEAIPFLAEIRLITKIFCATRYGEAPITSEESLELKQSLARLASHASRSRSLPHKV